MKRSFHRYRTFLHRIIFLFFFLFFLILRVFCCREKEFSPDLSIVSWPIQEEATNSFHSIKYTTTIIPNRIESKSFSRAEEGPFQGAVKWSEKRSAHLGLRERERERNRVNGISGPRSGSSTTTSGSKSDKLVAARESLNVARERERGRGWEQPQIDTSAAPSSRCCRDRYLIINRIPSAPRCSDTSQGR